ncbi:BTB/POZ domain-containing protein 9-like [Drosophila obscura]|uniref:BTB/POZ domain-containing protein 9-like n=1 Tax=Drosophila obscura TaxID=7282 RepID=UPI000BA0D890|nr:BTB/POZ domain-containing protein 9-like [Drosophila obscura]
MSTQATQGSSSPSIAAMRSPSNEPEQVPVHTFGEGVLATLNSLCMNKLYSDVELVVEDQHLPAHRLILAARSEYFRALLYGGMSESEKSVIRLPEVSLEAFKIILGYLYSGTLPISTLDVDASLKVLGLANQYGCLAISNAFKILEAARLYNLEELTMECLKFIDFNGGSMLNDDSFLMLSEEILEELLPRDTFIAEELEIFRAVCRWSRHNPSVDIKSLLSLVRLPLIEVKDLVGTVRQSGFVDPSTICDVIDKAIKLENLPYRAHVLSGLNEASEEWYAKRLIVNNNETVIKMNFWCIINTILIKSCLSIPLNCTVEISCDNARWVCVGKFTCAAGDYLPDIISFKRRPVRYIRIVHPESGRNNMLKEFQLFQAFLNDDIP